MTLMPKEEKPKSRRGTGASCRECRRLKVRCDREVPCGSCVRRGCSGICPDGQLSAIKSARYVLASTEELHQRIQTLTFRVHELEHALEMTYDSLVQTQSSPESGSSSARGVGGMPAVHPMLEPIRKKIAKDPREPDSDEEEGLTGSPTRPGMAMSESGNGMEFGTYDAALEDVLSNMHTNDPSSPTLRPGAVSQNVSQFAYNALPSKEEAWALIDAYYEHAIILHQPIPRARALSNIVVPAYSQDPTSLSAFDLSSLYSLLALGAFHDLKRTASLADAARWLSISQALLLSQVSALDSGMASIEALMLLALALLSTQQVDAVKAYHVVAAAMKCAQLSGLHKDSDEGMSSPAEAARRRHVFWELWSLDSALALEFDRPPTMLKAFIQFELPTSSPGAHDHDLLFLRWKYNLSAVSQEILTLGLLPSSTSAPYASVMVLDSKIRAARPASLPHEIESHAVQGGVDVEALDIVRSIVMNGLSQTVLLHLHRPYFAYAILRDETNPMSGRMSPSVLACYNGAIGILSSAAQLMDERPGLLSRLGGLWPSYIISTIVLYAIALLMPYWPNSSEAVKAADKAIKEIFEGSAVDCVKAQQAMPTLLRLQSLAHNTMQRHAQGLWVHPSHRESPISLPRNITPPQNQASGALSGFVPAFPNAASPVNGSFLGAMNLGLLDAGSLNPGVRQIPALPASNHASSSHLSSVQTPQLLSFSVPSSAEEANRSFNSPTTWDSVMLGIQTSTAGPAGLTNLGPSDGPTFPPAKVLKMAWPSLLKKLGVLN